jgi:hypothetical protein
MVQHRRHGLVSTVLVPHGLPGAASPVASTLTMPSTVMTSPTTQLLARSCFSSTCSGQARRHVTRPTVSCAKGDGRSANHHCGMTQPHACAAFGRLTSTQRGTRPCCCWSAPSSSCSRTFCQSMHTADAGSGVNCLLRQPWSAAGGTQQQVSSDAYGCCGGRLRQNLNPDPALWVTWHVPDIQKQVQSKPTGAAGGLAEPPLREGAWDDCAAAVAGEVELCDEGADVAHAHHGAPYSGQLA